MYIYTLAYIQAYIQHAQRAYKHKHKLLLPLIQSQFAHTTHAHDNISSLPHTPLLPSIQRSQIKQKVDT